MRRGLPSRLPESADAGTLAGSLLIAHPRLSDPNFRRTVVLLAAHSPKIGAMGVILNRPVGKTLGQADIAFAAMPGGDFPLYAGGPVDITKAIFAGWVWDAAAGHLQLHFGLDREAAAALHHDQPGAKLRAFVGHAAWTPGQLENELASPTWIVAKIDPALLDTLDGQDLWRTLIKKVAPGLTLLAEAPETPEKN